MSATQLKTQAIADNAISTPKIGDGQITQPKLAAGVGGNTDHSFRFETSGTSVPNNTETKIGWDNEFFDTDNLHDNAINNTRVTITAATAGKWLIEASIMFPNTPPNAEGIVRFQKNAGTIAVSANALPSPVFTNHTIRILTLVSLAAGDFVEVAVTHNYGTTQTIGGGLPQGRSFFEGIRIAT